MMVNKTIKELCDELGLESMQEYILSVNEIFNVVMKKEKNSEVMLEWIDAKIEDANKSGEVILQGLNKKEQFLYAFGALNALIAVLYGSEDKE